MQQKLQNEKIKTEEERKNNEDIKVLCQSGQIQAVFNKYEKQIRQLFIYYIESCERQLDKYSTDILTFKGFIMFNSQFGIIPSVLALSELQSIFRSLTRNKMLQEDPVIGLVYDEFKEALLRISIKKKEIFDKIHEKAVGSTIQMNPASMQNLIKDMNDHKEETDLNDEQTGINFHF